MDQDIYRLSTEASGGDLVRARKLRDLISLSFFNDMTQLMSDGSKVYQTSDKAGVDAGNYTNQPEIARLLHDLANVQEFLETAEAANSKFHLQMEAIVTGIIKKLCYLNTAVNFGSISYANSWYGITDLRWNLPGLRSRRDLLYYVTTRKSDLFSTAELFSGSLHEFLHKDGTEVPFELRNILADVVPVGMQSMKEQFPRRIVHHVETYKSTGMLSAYFNAATEWGHLTADYLNATYGATFVKIDDLADLITLTDAPESINLDGKTLDADIFDPKKYELAEDITNFNNIVESVVSEVLGASSALLGFNALDLLTEVSFSSSLDSSGIESLDVASAKALGPLGDVVKNTYTVSASNFGIVKNRILRSVKRYPDTSQDDPSVGDFSVFSLLGSYDVESSPSQWLRVPGNAAGQSVSSTFQLKGKNKIDTIMWEDSETVKYSDTNDLYLGRPRMSVDYSFTYPLAITGSGEHSTLSFDSVFVDGVLVYWHTGAVMENRLDLFVLGPYG
jgi:hypothetical protein